MNIDNQTQRELQPWEYDSPPTLFDLVQNNAISSLVRLMMHVFFRAYLRVYHRFKVIHREAVDSLSSAIIVANHSSHLDVLSIQSAFPILRLNSVRSIAAKDYFFKNFFIRTISFFIANTIPLTRQGYDAAALGFSKECLKKGANVILFPEGTRTKTGNMQPFKMGVGIMAVDAGAKIVPVYIDGAFSGFGKGKLFPRPKKITVIFGEPVSYPARENTKESWLRIAGDIESKVRSLQKSIQQGSTQ